MFRPRPVEEEHLLYGHRTPLAGQVAVVTGAGRGIGAAIARKLAALGATAVLCGTNPIHTRGNCPLRSSKRRQGGGDSV